VSDARINTASATPVSAARYDGRSAEELAQLFTLPRLIVYDAVPSTLDVVHELGEQGAPAGTLVLANAQTAGRGRMRRAWRSDPGAGIWLTLLERPSGDDALGVLALRIALALAPALDAFAMSRVQLKWPNDLYVSGGKLAGVLVEARWHGARLDWLAVGVGINVLAPEGLLAAGLLPGTDRIVVLREIVPALRSAVSLPGTLSREEVARFHERDLAIGRRAAEPAVGVVAGIDVDGALLVDTAEERIAVHAGSLILESDVDSFGGSS
jgi:BirA family biotin operon repressor/biotin-[acetyl-CoA-carboxylase] ligase